MRNDMSSSFQAADDKSSSVSTESLANEVANGPGKDTLRSTETIPKSTSQTSGALVQLRELYPQLPDLRPHQHTTLFYLSLVEGRCRTQAANTLNVGRNLEDSLPESHHEVHILAQRLFREVCDQLHKAGILPDELAGQELSDIRKSYLSSFDNLLYSIAVKKRNNSPDKTYSSLFERSDAYALDKDFPINSMANARAFSLPRLTSTPIAQDSVPTLGSLSLGDFVYRKEYKEICLLGKGGFGKVYKALNHLDQVQYAIKKVVLRGDSLSGKFAKTIVKDLLSELRALARLNHVNIVRYHHSWAETRAGHMHGDSSSSSSDSGLGGEEEDLEALGDSTSIKLDHSTHTAPYFKNNTNNELALASLLRKESRHERRVSQMTDNHDDSVIFERSKSSNEQVLIRPKGSSFFRTVESSDEASDEDTEEVARKDEAGRNPLSGLTIVIFIKMALHPMNLDEYLWPEQQKSSVTLPIEHCYHTMPTARMLLGVLDGVEYIHKNNIVHRDLKPSNILLSVSSNAASSMDNYINVSDCLECPTKRHDRGRDLCLIPHIGDFGLVADIQDTESKSSDSPTPDTMLISRKTNAHYSYLPPALSGLSSRQPGTRFYCAPKSPLGNAIICPKVDVYSLGIIALEMIHKFGTRSERAIELDRLTTDGVFPQGFEDHEMSDGIKHMLCRERAERWNCAEVRQWLEGMVEKAQSGR